LNNFNFQRHAALLLSPAMSSTYDELLTATVQHLERMKASGARFVEVNSESLRALSAAPVRRAISQLQPSASVASRMAEPTPAVPLSPLPSSPKAIALAEIRERALQCMKCAKLASTRTNVVFGVGNPDAQLMFVGEAPGADEDVQGEPFVGAAGQLLTRMISAMGLSRDEVYIANILKCRPDMPEGSSGNRKPTPEEMQTCIPYLHAQIDLIQPKVLVALGGTAVEGLLSQTGITKLRGKWQTYRGIPLMPTYHPAYLLRNQANSEKRKVWEDLLAVMEKLDLQISEKQRGYFLRP
jgi:uracil-DNA glycosylase